MYRPQDKRKQSKLKWSRSDYKIDSSNCEVAEETDLVNIAMRTKER